MAKRKNPKLSTLSALQKKSLKVEGVIALYLFGSRAEGTESPLSDYDYGVLTEKRGYQKGGRLYFKLYELLSSISKRTLENDVIDIVFLRDVGLELRFHVIRKGKVIFDGHSQKRLDFEVETELLYCDYRPILEAMDHALIESL